MKLPEPYELIELFESEPEVLDKDVDGWYHNTITFTVNRDGDEIVCTISPAYSDLRIKWLQKKRDIVNLEINNIESLSVIREEGREILCAQFDESLSIRDLYIRIKPDFHILWGTGE
jgi:hypothetical protein